MENQAAHNEMLQAIDMTDAPMCLRSFWKAEVGFNEAHKVFTETGKGEAKLSEAFDDMTRMAEFVRIGTTGGYDDPAVNMELYADVKARHAMFTQIYKSALGLGRNQ